MNTYSFAQEAIQDLNEICDYLGQRNRATAGKVFDEVRRRCKQVAQFPKSGKNYGQLTPGLRGFVVREYIVFYYPRPDGIDVVRVLSGYRDLEDVFSEE